MVGLFGTLGLILGHLVLTVNALAASVGQRFAAGIGGGVLRAALTIIGTICWLRVGWFPGSGSPPSMFAALLVVALILGPIVSLAVLFAAYRRAWDIPAAQEEQAERVVNAWLLVGIPDAIGVVVALFAYLFASGGS